MNREHILAAFYDLILAIGGETQLAPLLTRVLQRLLHHTGFPVGAVFLEPVAQGETTTALLAAAIGDHALAKKVGQRLALPGELLRDKAELANDGAALEPLLGNRDYPCFLRLPVNAAGTVLLLGKTMPRHTLPLTQIFQPVMHNLSQAIQLCRHHEAVTRRLASDRDRARNELEAALRRSERERSFLRSLMDTLPDLVWLKDPEGVYLACNQPFCRLYGASEADIIGRTDHDFVARELADFFRANDQAAIAAGRPTTNEEWLTFAEGGYRGLFETTKTPMFAADGSLVGVLGIAHDITAHKGGGGNPPAAS
ncbi:MAG: PAS domain-containing protein [Pseudomonadota bacterium]